MESQEFKQIISVQILADGSKIEKDIRFMVKDQIMLGYIVNEEKHPHEHGVQIFLFGKVDVDDKKI